MKSFGERIADLLIADGLLTQKQLGEVLESQKKQGGRLLKLLLERQFVSDLDMTVALARCLNTPPVTLAKMHVPTEITELIAELRVEGVFERHDFSAGRGRARSARGP